MTSVAADPVTRASAPLTVRVAGLLLIAAAVLQVGLVVLRMNTLLFEGGRVAYLVTLVLVAAAALVASLPRLGARDGEDAAIDRAGAVAFRVFAVGVLAGPLLASLTPADPRPLSAAAGILVLVLGALTLVAGAVGVWSVARVGRTPAAVVLAASAALGWSALVGVFWVLIPVLLPTATQELLIAATRLGDVVGPLLLAATGVACLIAAGRSRVSGR